MKLHNMLPFRFSGAIGLAFLSITTRVTADSLSQTYCSTQNTGSSFDVVNNIYQSNGACYTTCNAQSYAFAIVQFQNCWCSNYIPAEQDSTSNCSENCPGYPDEQCGNRDGGYFGYVQLPHPASGTAGASSGIASSTNSPSSSPQQSATSQDAVTSIVSTTIEKTVTQSQSQSVSVSYVTPTQSSSSTSSPSSTHSVTPVTSVVLSTISGAVVTQFVTATPSAAPNVNPDQDAVEQQHQGISGGAIAGIVIGVLAGIALIVAAALFYWRRRRSSGSDPESSHSGSRAGMTRNVSVLSKAGLLSLGNRPSMGERDRDDIYVTPATGQNSVRHSMLFTGLDGVEATSPLDSSHSNDSGKSARAMVYDQRLNPSALFANHENGSRISIQDQQDYSRPLGVMNPDPRASFDSRISRN